MAKRETNRVAWALAAILAVVLPAGLGVLEGRLQHYCTARYHGAGEQAGNPWA